MARRKRKVDCNGKLILLSDKERSGLAMKGVRKWKAPLAMPDTMVKKVLAGKVCGAILTNGKFCISKAVVSRAPKPPPFRCPGHGGEGRGQKKGAQCNLSHGIYTDCLLDTELDLWDQLDVTAVDEEIKLTKLRLRRALKADKEKNPTYMDIVEEIYESVDGEMVLQKQIKRNDNGYSVEINKIINQLVRLCAQRCNMLDIAGEVDRGGQPRVVIYLPKNGRGSE